MDKITLELWLQVYHNDLVLIKILGMFDLKEQIALMPVCQRFQYIIRDVIWKKKYHDLLIQKTNTTFVMGWKQRAGVAAVVTKAMSKKSQAICDKRDFDEHELYKFLEYLRQHLKSLTVKSVYMCKDMYEGVIFNYPGNFDNLQVLKYHDVTLNDENIKTISEKCKRLKELHLSKIENHLTAKYIDKLTNLETFCIEKCNVTWSYEKFFNIFQLPLKRVQLFDISFEKQDTNFICDTESVVGTLEVLKIQNVASRYDYAFDILRYASKPLGQLQELQIMCSSNLKSHHFDLISEKCVNLQQFYITRSWFEVDNLKFPLNLKELHIDNCVILSPENAWYILTQLNLSVLEISKIDSRKMYNFNYFLDLGGSLKTLKLQPFLGNDSDKEFWMEIFENSSSDSFRHVESLTCEGLYATDSHLELISQKIPKIQHLHIEDSELSGRYIYNLQNLKLLSLKYCMCIDFWYFIKILQTSRKLESLAIIYTEFENVDSDDDVRVPSIGSCSLHSLNIDYDIFSICLPFWLNLLQLNLVPMEIFSRFENFSNKFDCEFLLAVFNDKDISKNLQRFVINGYFNEASLKNRKCFVEILYHPRIRDHVERVRVSDCQIGTSLDKTECLERITWCLNNYSSYDFTIEFK